MLHTIGHICVSHMDLVKCIKIATVQPCKYCKSRGDLVVPPEGDKESERSWGVQKTSMGQIGESGRMQV